MPELKFNPTVPLLFYAKGGSYEPGQGANAGWTKVIPDALYCEWKGGYGDRAIAAQAVGVSDMATVRTFYHPTVLAKLRRVQVVIIKNSDLTAIINGVPDKNNPNTYELWGGADDVGEQHQYLEFRVRRYEGK